MIDEEVRSIRESMRSSGLSYEELVERAKKRHKISLKRFLIEQGVIIKRSKYER